jgi:hypothetical protein
MGKTKEPKKLIIVETKSLDKIDINEYLRKQLIILINEDEGLH